MLLPGGFWDALARLWQQVLRELEPCHSAGGRAEWSSSRSLPGEYRPLTILSCAWRIGARLLVQQLTEWIEQLGILAWFLQHRGLKDSYLRLLESLSSPCAYLQEDLTKFFDSVRLSDLLEVLAHLGCPTPIRRLVQSYYEQHRRVFTKDGTIGGSWHVVRRGLAQGCPLSPMLAASVMAMWSSMVESAPDTKVESMSFRGRSALVVPYGARASECEGLE